MFKKAGLTTSAIILAVVLIVGVVIGFRLSAWLDSAGLEEENLQLKEDIIRLESRVELLQEQLQEANQQPLVPIDVPLVNDTQNSSDISLAS